MTFRDEFDFLFDTPKDYNSVTGVLFTAERFNDGLMSLKDPKLKVKIIQH